MLRLKILLVENDPTDQIAVQRLFQIQGLDYDLDVADSCHLALEFLEQSEYDIVLLDYNLNDGTGLELLS